MASAIKYQKHIDGLRAVAVLSVILYHLDPVTLPGGFLGVDIFFVISGYLITGILLKNMHSGSFRFTEFYKRRIKRILPLYFVVLSLSSVVAWRVLLPGDFSAYAKSVVSTLIFVSNIFFLRGSGYFAPEADSVPLLHTWSLSVEEQYYLFWPLLLLLLMKLGHRVRVVVLVAGVLGGAAIAQYTVNHSKDLAFFTLHCRFFELMAGALLAHIHFGGARLESQTASAAAWAGLAMVLGSVLLFSDHSALPGFGTLLPVAGTCLLIAGAGAPSLVNRLLCAKGVVYTGLISYSLYLWHWPVLSFMRYLRIEEGIVTLTLAVLTFWGLSHLSWKFVENPIRYSQLTFRPALVRLYILPLLVCGSLATVVIRSGGLPARLPDVAAVTEARMNQHGSALRETCTRRNRSFDLDPACVINPSDSGEVDLVLWGDSHASHFLPFLEQVAAEAGVSVRDFVAPGCPPLPAARRLFRTYSQWCIDHNSRVLDHITDGEYSGVLIAANWYKYQHGEGLLGLPGRMQKTEANSRAVIAETLEQDVAALVAAGKEVYLLEPVPVFERNPSKCEIKNAFHGPALVRECRLRKEQYVEQLAFTHDLFERLGQRWPSLRIVSFGEFFCGDGWCRGMKGDVPLYRDSNHLTEAGSRLLGSWFVTTRKLHIFRTQTTDNEQS